MTSNNTAHPERLIQSRVAAMFTQPVKDGGLGYRYLRDGYQRDKT